MVFQLTLDPAQGNCYVVFRVVTLQVDGGHDVQFARADELHVEVGEPGNVPVFEHTAGDGTFNVRRYTLAHQEASVAVDQHNGNDRQQNTDDDRAPGAQHGRTRDLGQEHAGKRHHQADQCSSILSENGP